MCVPTQTPCPINSVSVVASNAAITDTSAYSINENGGKILFSNANTSGDILAEVIISDNQPRANPGYVNYSYSPDLLDLFYGNNKCNDLIGEFTYDSNSKKIDTYKYYNLLSDNNILPSLVGLPEFNAMAFNHDLGCILEDTIEYIPVAWLTLKMMEPLVKS